MISGTCPTRLVGTASFLLTAIMYDQETLEFAQELGVDPADISSSDPYADDPAVAYQQQNQYQTHYPFEYDDLQDDIGDYMHLLSF